MTRSSPLAGRLRAELLVFAGYVLLTLIFTYPFALHLGNGLVGLDVDVEQHLWSFWWMRKAIELGTNPYYTDWLYYPTGASLYFFAASRVHALLSIPLQALFGLIGAYNLLELLTFIGSAYAAYWLAHDITGDRISAFVAGIVFAFAPTQVFHFDVGQPNLRSVEFLPVYVLCLRRWLDGGRVRWLLGAAIALALSSFADWQFPVYLELFTGALLLAILLQRRREWLTALRDLAGRTLALQALYAITIAPVLVRMLGEINQPEPYMFRRREDTLVHSADLLAFFIPNPNHPLWRDWAHRTLEQLTTPGVLVTIVSFSYVALLLAALGAARDWRRARFWVLCGLAFLVLALGPELRVLGQATGIPLPYEALYQISMIRISRAPARYVIITLLCLSVLAAIGTHIITAGLSRRQSDFSIREDTRRYTKTFHIFAYLRVPSRILNGCARRRWPTALIVAALCFELLPAPIPVAPPADAPAFFTDGTLRDAGALLEAPDPSNRGMYFQILHGHPVVYGELSRDNPPGPMLEYIRKGLFAERTDEIFDQVKNWECVASTYRITHLVIYPSDRAGVQADRQRAAERLGPQALLRDTPQGTLYRLPAPSDSTCFLFGEGWRDPSPDPGQPIYRWTKQTASLGLLRSAPGHIRLQFSSHSFAMPRHLQIRRDGQVLAQVSVDVAPHPVAVDLDLPAGLTLIELHSVEPASSPENYGYNDDIPVSIGYAELSAQER
jgi:hypothetical protein